MIVQLYVVWDMDGRSGIRARAVNASSDLEAVEAAEVTFNPPSYRVAVSLAECGLFEGLKGATTFLYGPDGWRRY